MPLLLHLSASLAGCAHADVRSDESPAVTGGSSPVDPAVAARNAQITARERVQRISGELEQLRGRKFKEEVKVEVQSAAEFRAFVDREIDKELPAELAMRQTKALQAFGLLPAGYELRKGLSDLYVSQAGAYYNPETKTFYILMAGLPDDQMDSLILHELDHALQDQYFDLKALKDAAQKNPNEDARSALNFVLEGEATFVMLKYQTKKTGMDLDAFPVERQEMVFGMMRDFDRRMLLTSAQLAKPKGPEGEEIRKSIAALKEVPGALFWSLHDPYMKGQYGVFKRFASGGWPAVDALYTRPPSSTEQMLHPEKLDGERDEPTSFTPPSLLSMLGPGWTQVYTNTHGEAGLLAFFDEHVSGQKARAAAGWDGDVFALYEGPDNAQLLGWWTAWDSEKDALEFEEAMKRVKSGTLGGPDASPEPVILRRGDRVIVLAGRQQALDLVQRGLGR